MISVKYDVKSIIGANLTSPCTFNFVSKIGGVAQPDSDGSIVVQDFSAPLITNNFDPVEESVAKTAFTVYPNPVSSTAKIRYNLATETQVSLKVINSVGIEVATLINGKQPAGDHILNWNAANMATGIYFIQLKTGEETKTYKVFFIK